MPKKWILTMLLAAALLAGPAPVRADAFNHVCRYLGWGWSDGYNAPKPCRAPQPSWYSFPQSVAPQHSQPAPAPVPQPTTPQAPEASDRQPTPAKTAPARREPQLPSRLVRPVFVPLR